MKEEDNIFKKIGRENAFRVPDGYFDRLASEVMDKLPAEKGNTIRPNKPVVRARLKPWLYAAAMLVGVVLIIGVLIPMQKDANIGVAKAVANDTEVVSDQLIDVAIKGTMLDDYSLYVYLSDVNTE